MNKSSVIEIDPITRVEGDLKFQAQCDENSIITDAQSSGSMFRGFEQFLVGKKPMDALGITPRICGMCSSAQSYVCSNALRDLFHRYLCLAILEWCIPKKVFPSLF